MKRGALRVFVLFLSGVLVAMSPFAFSSDAQVKAKQGAEKMSALQEMLITPGDLHKVHTGLEAGCSACHESFTRERRDQLCLNCHETIAADRADKTGFHGKLIDADCDQCHTEHLGENAAITLFDSERFDHQRTGFELLGEHQSVGCSDCHTDEVRKKNIRPGAFRIEAQACESCHVDPHLDPLGAQGDISLKAPDKAPFSTHCADCHNEKGWQDTSFDHDKTDFPLEHRHGELQCETCHADLTFSSPAHRAPDATAGSVFSCGSCHQVNDVHRGTMGQACEDCHSVEDWSKVTFNHDDTRFPLKGAHQDQSCMLCHAETLVKLDSLFVNTSATTQPSKKTAGAKWNEKRPATGHAKDALIKNSCVSCHQVEDIHAGAYGDVCSDCHAEKSWSTVSFDHNKRSDFKLTGKHEKLDCLGCHATGKAINVDKPRSACIDCHESSDIHRGELGRQCESCHSDSRLWTEVDFDHEFTDFPLIGIHKIVGCHGCHGDKTFQLPLTACDDCHLPGTVHDFVFKSDCQSCHSSTSWDRWKFNHDQTDFPLEGAHQQVTCLTCHNSDLNKSDRKSADLHNDGRSGVSQHQSIMTAADKPSKECFACHEKDDVHDQRFGRQCGNCHSQSNFRDVLNSRGRGR